MKTAYRPDIDGLRAIAVMSVVLFHAFPEWIPGGFIGVDVFFVISGFLISGMLFDQAAQGRIDLIDFYARRIRRIFPALIVVLAASLIVGWLIFLPADLVRLGKSTIASAAFAANFYFWFQSGYFSPDAHTFPLLHMWSLGVEEQFYIAWPLLIIALRTRARWFAVDRGNVLHLPHPVRRAGRNARFEFLFAVHPRLGADGRRRTGLALIQRDAAGCRGRRRGGWPGDDIVERLRFRSGRLLSRLARHNSRRRHRIDHRKRQPQPNCWPCFVESLAVYVGRISYPLYLWHWPTLVFYAAFKFAAPTLLERGLAVALSFILATLTYRFIERPIRGGRLSRSPHVSLDRRHERGGGCRPCHRWRKGLRESLSARTAGSVSGSRQRRWQTNACWISPQKRPSLKIASNGNAPSSSCGETRSQQPSSPVSETCNAVKILAWAS